MATEGPTLDHGMLVRQWSWPLRMVFWSMFIGVVLWGLTIGLHWVWALRAQPDSPHAYEQQVLDRELAVLQTLRPGLFEPAKVAIWIGTSIRDTALLSATGFARAAMNWPVEYRQRMAKARGGEVPPASTDAGAELVMSQVAQGGGTREMLLTGTYIFATRTAMYICALPLLLLAAAVGLADGLVARAQRKASAGRESASIYHRAKLALTFVPIMGYLMFLGLPTMAEPSLVLAPLALVVGGLLRVQCAFYKKYL